MGRVHGNGLELFAYVNYFLLVIPEFVLGDGFFKIAGVIVERLFKWIEQRDFVGRNFMVEAWS